jgi:soluble lytic murein transglycosylase-like protein
MQPSTDHSRISKFTLTTRDYILAIIGAVLAMAIIGVIMLINNSRTPLPYTNKGDASGITAAWIPPTVKHWDKQINEMSKKYDIDANVIAILITMESGGDAKAKSDAGAVGLMQVTPPTAGDIAKKYLKKPVTKYDLTDPGTNIEFGTAYLAWLRDQFGTMQQGPEFTSTVELIAAGYNGGPGAANALEQGKGLSDTQTVVYSRDAFNMYRERVSAKSYTFDRWKERGGSILLDDAKKSQQQ